MGTIAVFGGTGQIGRNLIRKLATNNYKVTVITRNIHTKGNFIKTQANAGYIDLVEANPFNENEIKPFFKKNDICINLIGILFERLIFDIWSDYLSHQFFSEQAFSNLCLYLLLQNILTLLSFYHF